MSRRNAQLLRVLTLIDALQRGPRVIQSLSDELRVTTRTIRRDLDALREAGIDLHVNDQGQWRIHSAVLTAEIAS